MFKLKKSFTLKLFVTNILILLLALISILGYFYNFLKSKELVQFNQSLEMLNTKIAEQTDTLLYSLDKIALQIASNPYIYNLFYQLPQDTATNYFDQDHFLRSEVRNFLNSYNFKNNSATRICLYDNFNNFVDAGYKLTDNLAIDYFFKSNDFQDITLFFQSTSHKTLFIPPKTDPFAMSSKYSSQISTFSVVRPIKNYTILDSPIYGYVEVQLDYEFLDNLFTSLDPSIVSFIIDSNGQVIYPLPEEFLNFDSSELTHDRYLITSSMLNQVDGKVLLLQNKAALFYNYKSLQYMIIFIFLIVFLASASSHFLLMAYFTKPLKQLQHSIESISLDNLSLHLLDDPSQDEFIQLNHAFTKMFEHLNHSIQQTIFARTSELKSHLLALQAQINPHFIHNVLSVMSVIAEENNVPQLENMCNKLSNMLRFSSSYTKTSVTLEEELCYTQSYLELMQDRYESLFTFSFNTGTEAKHIIVPKLIIQPLTENCFNHGFKQKPSPWHIDINFYTQHNFWFVSISDNGVGFNTDFINHFKDYTSNIDLAHTAEELTKLQIGKLSLINLYLRLRIVYEDHLIFTLENNSFGGATITLGGLIHDYENTCS